MDEQSAPVFRRGNDLDELADVLMINVRSVPFDLDWPPRTADADVTIDPSIAAVPAIS
nr:hypothetical protein [Pseudoduganella buxea]